MWDDGWSYSTLHKQWFPLLRTRVFCRKTSKQIISLQTQLGLKTKLYGHYKTDLKARDELVVPNTRMRSGLGRRTHKNWTRETSSTAWRVQSRKASQTERYWTVRTGSKQFSSNSVLKILNFLHHKLNAITVQYLLSNEDTSTGSIKTGMSVEYENSIKYPTSRACERAKPRRASPRILLPPTKRASSQVYDYDFLYALGWNLPTVLSSCSMPQIYFNDCEAKWRYSHSRSEKTYRRFSWRVHHSSYRHYFPYVNILLN